MGKKTRVVAFYLPNTTLSPRITTGGAKALRNGPMPRRRSRYSVGTTNRSGRSGFLRFAGARNAQAEMARAHGIEAFCYYHYWFGGKRLPERPFNEVLESSEPDFPFFLCWANATWSRGI